MQHARIYISRHRAGGDRAIRTVAKVLTSATVVAVFVACGASGTEIAANTDSGPTESVATIGSTDYVMPEGPHPSFDLSTQELMEMLEGLPESVVTAVRERPRLFLEYAGQMLTLDPGCLILVDKVTLLEDDYAPQDLRDLAEYRDRLVLNREDLSLRALIMPDLLAMVEAARLDGVTLDISSSYRSYAYQENLFEYWTEELGLKEAERVSARAGSSQHQLGTTLDFGSVTPEYAATPGGRWLARNAWRFGFSLSYPEGLENLTGYSFEPWHYRYISRTGTRMEREFFGGIQQVMLEFWDHRAEFFRDRYRATDGDR